MFTTCVPLGIFSLFHIVGAVSFSYITAIVSNRGNNPNDASHLTGYPPRDAVVDDVSIATLNFFFKTKAVV